MKVKIAGGVYLYWDSTNMFIVNGLPKWVLVPHWTYCAHLNFSRHLNATSTTLHLSLDKSLNTALWLVQKLAGSTGASKCLQKFKCDEWIKFLFWSIIWKMGKRKCYAKILNRTKKPGWGDVDLEFNVVLSIFLVKHAVKMREDKLR